VHIMYFDLVCSSGEAVHKLNAILTSRTPGTKDFNVMFLLHILLVPYSIVWLHSCALYF